MAIWNRVGEGKEAGEAEVPLELSGQAEVQVIRVNGNTEGAPCGVGEAKLGVVEKAEGSGAGGGIGLVAGERETADLIGGGEAQTG